MSMAVAARQNAVHFEAKKTGFGQAQDGWSLTLRIQDIDVPANVRDARKGTRFMVALVEIADDETPVPQRQQTDAAETTPAGSSPPARPAGVEKHKRIFSDMTPAQQAGMLCLEMSFQKFLDEKYHDAWVDACEDIDVDAPDDEVAAETVRRLCNVKSRSILTTANPHWKSILLAYRLWQREAEVVPA